ncbi:hemolysin III family protein [Paraburkholderia jirisanensis]
MHPGAADATTGRAFCFLPFRRNAVPIGERLNCITHLVGALLSAVGLAALVTLGALDGDSYKVVSFSVYGAMLFVLYAVSTLYHSVKAPRLKAVLQKCDHAAIYLLIAGSYTPFTLVTLRGPWGWSLFGVIWGLAGLGIAQELTLGRRTRSVSMVLYVLMGWLGLIAIEPLVAALPAAGTGWLVAGGVIYSAGIYFFVNDERIRHGHGIWHLFVLAGSLCQFVSVARYVA